MKTPKERPVLDVKDCLGGEHAGERAMKELEYPIREWTDPTVDKSTWPDGPWKTEPDKIQWVDELSQLDCLMVRNHMGSWCGYVGVDSAHPYYKRGYDDAGHLDCHGGLNYAAPCSESEYDYAGICHIPYPGRPHDIWWFGFDCAHFMDRMPRHESMMRELGYPPRRMREHEERYRDRAYVEKECRRLAAQLAAIGRNAP